MPDNLTDVSIVVLSHNRRDDLKTNLHQLLDMARACGCELIIVDNASDDGSVEMILELIGEAKEARFIRNADNLGVAGGRNSGWRVAERDYILNIDDDTFVTGEAVAALRSVLVRRPDAGIVSPRILHAETKAPQFDLGLEDCRAGNFHGACHLLRKSLVDRIGLNDEACSFGGEELDYSIRARAAGFDVLYTPLATVLHKSLVRQGKEGRARRQRWVYNFVRVYHKHFAPGFASLLTTRFVVGHLASGWRVHGLRFLPTILNAAFQGRRDGRRQYDPVPDFVVEFYKNPDLRPDAGNVPLYRKLIAVLGA
ncbi:MAG: glycosyltransferase family 2 protein [Parvibaculum sp.]|nr:glycosyltransferase family 2 protein [Parvibaculum sp.]